MPRKDGYLFGFQIGLNVFLLLTIFSMPSLVNLPGWQRMILGAVTGFMISFILKKLLNKFHSEEYR